MGEDGLGAVAGGQDTVHGCILMQTPRSPGGLMLSITVYLNDGSVQRITDATDVRITDTNVLDVRGADDASIAMFAQGLWSFWLSNAGASEKDDWDVIYFDGRRMRRRRAGAWEDAPVA